MAPVIYLFLCHIINDMNRWLHLISSQLDSAVLLWILWLMSVDIPATNHPKWLETAKLLFAVPNRDQSSLYSHVTSCDRPVWALNNDWPRPRSVTIKVQWPLPPPSAPPPPPPDSPFQAEAPYLWWEGSWRFQGAYCLSVYERDQFKTNKNGRKFVMELCVTWSQEKIDNRCHLIWH